MRRSGADNSLQQLAASYFRDISDEYKSGADIKLYNTDNGGMERHIRLLRAPYTCRVGISCQVGVHTCADRVIRQSSHAKRLKPARLLDSAYYTGMVASVSSNLRCFADVPLWTCVSNIARRQSAYAAAHRLDSAYQTGMLAGVSCNLRCFAEVPSVAGSSTSGPKASLSDRERIPSPPMFRNLTSWKFVVEPLE